MKKGKDILMARAGNGDIFVNIPHTIVRHSPDGFEWGYRGSGPSDLALNILILFTDQCTADRLYQEFKLDFISSMPKQGGMIKSSTIQEWLGKRI